MASKDERDLYSALTGETDVPASEEDFSLEEILAEYGAGREQRLMEAVEQEARREEPPEASAPAAPRPSDGEPEASPARPAAPRPRRQRTAPAQDRPAGAAAEPSAREKEAEQLERELPRPPKPVTLEDVVGSTVDAVMEETAHEPLLRPRRGLFSRKKLVETEQLYDPPEPEPEEPAEIDTIGPEPHLAEAAADCRAETKRRRRTPPGGGGGVAAAGGPHGGGGLRL